MSYCRRMKLSVVITAYNEEKCLPATLDSVAAEIERIGGAELIVVDNESTDRTAAIAVEYGAVVHNETEHNIARVRNRGAGRATGDVLMFIDADTRVKPGLFTRIADEMNDTACLGGAVAVSYDEPMPRLTELYVKFCLIIGRLMRIRNGAAQFCRRDAFDELGGYDETIFVGEDIDFQFRLERLARTRGDRTAFISDLPVITSARRFVHFGLARTVFYSHPLTLLLACRYRRLWRSWYENAVR